MNCKKKYKKFPLKNLYEVEFFLEKISKIKNIICAKKAIKKLPKCH